MEMKFAEALCEIDQQQILATDAGNNVITQPLIGVRPQCISAKYPFPPSSIPKPEIKPMRELRDDSLVDLKFMMEDSGMGKTFITRNKKGDAFPAQNRQRIEVGFMPTTSRLKTQLLTLKMSP